MNPLLKILATVGAALAAVAARKAIERGWKAATGHEAPDDPESPEYGWGEALAFGAITGALVGAARLAVMRKAAQTAQSARRKSRSA